MKKEDKSISTSLLVDIAVEVLVSQKWEKFIGYLCQVSGKVKAIAPFFDEKVFDLFFSDLNSLV